jgi:hypothetical protein
MNYVKIGFALALLATTAAAEEFQTYSGIAILQDSTEQDGVRYCNYVVERLDDGERVGAMSLAIRVSSLKPGASSVLYCPKTLPILPPEIINEALRLLQQKGST